LVEVFGDTFQFVAQLEFMDYAGALCKSHLALTGIEAVECLTKKIVRDLGWLCLA